MSKILEACDRLDTFIAEDRVIRGAWTQGHDRACLLAALSPECAKANDSSACPANLLPEWFAHLTVFIDDSGSLEKWPSVIRRYASLIRRSGVLSAEDWARLDFRCRVVTMIEARKYAEGFADVLSAVDRVKDLCERAGKGDKAKDEDWAGAAGATRAAGAAGAAGDAMWAAGAARAAMWAAGAAMWAAMWAADRLIDGFLNELESAIVEAETRN